MLCVCAFWVEGRKERREASGGAGARRDPPGLEPPQSVGGAPRDHPVEEPRLRRHERDALRGAEPRGDLRGELHANRAAADDTDARGAAEVLRGAAEVGAAGLRGGGRGARRGLRALDGLGVGGAGGQDAKVAREGCAYRQADAAHLLRAVSGRAGGAGAGGGGSRSRAAAAVAGCGER